VWYFHSKNTSAVFCLSHDTKWKHFEAFLARIIANLIQKFKTQGSAVTSLRVPTWKSKWIEWIRTAAAGDPGWLGITFLWHSYYRKVIFTPMHFGSIKFRGDLIPRLDQ
jgi:hypothetical protein